jgi:hypothetical protein
MSLEQENQEKDQLLKKIGRLQARGIHGTQMTMNNTLGEIKSEFDRRSDIKNLEGSIRLQRRLMISAVTGIETLSETFGEKLPKKIRPRLKGWSEQVQTEIEDFDDTFEELYDLYKDSAKVHPLLRLVATLGFSAAAYHISVSMAESSNIPGLTEDVLRENPDLQRQLTQAAFAKMGGFGEFMSAVTGGGGGGGGPIPAPMGAVPAQAFPSAAAPAPPPPTAGTRGVPFNVSSQAVQQQQQQQQQKPQRREMTGPAAGVNVDDVLRAFHAERDIASGPGIASVHSTVFTPNGPPPTPPRNGREGVGSASDPLIGFSNNINNNNNSDNRSDGSGGTANTERRRAGGGGRGRPRIEPVGAVLNLNV